MAPLCDYDDSGARFPAIGFGDTMVPATYSMSMTDERLVHRGSSIQRHQGNVVRDDNHECLR